MDLFQKCREWTAAKEVMAAGYYPYFRPISSSVGDIVVVNGQEMIMIGSNNYLGLVGDLRVKEAAAEASLKYGSGCTGSRFLNGTLDLHIELEEKLAKFMKRESALVFSTGFQTNLGTISCLVGKDDIILCDRSNHASIMDGCRLSYGKIMKFAHNDMDDLRRVLEIARTNGLRGGIFIITDGVFSMEGDIANLPAMCEIAEEYGAQILVDDAHSIGVLGEGGRGTAEHYNLIDKVGLTMGTFSKSFASLGGFIVGDEDTIHYVKHFARELIFSASIPPGAAAAAIKALEIIQSEPERREQLWKNTNRMHKGLRDLGYDIGETQTPVVPVMIGDDLTCFKLWKDLSDEGIFANAVVPPAVAPKMSLIRTSYTATHTDEQLDKVLDTFARLGKKYGVL
ncbi:MAG: aminotransferase class I/II-fold pyridoxal phosphate-dependent enzyme [candidate division Zixibacteria bacterium]|nr:aminotransferase class I/II-fold pyridoxal phosphate-dependent enzyme [candidate division Zixibacteria bacterium]